MKLTALKSPYGRHAALWLMDKDEQVRFFVKIEAATADATPEQAAALVEKFVGLAGKKGLMVPDPPEREAEDAGQSSPA